MVVKEGGRKRVHDSNYGQPKTVNRSVSQSVSLPNVAMDMSEGILGAEPGQTRSKEQGRTEGGGKVMTGMVVGDVWSGPKGKTRGGVFGCLG